MNLADHVESLVEYLSLGNMKDERVPEASPWLPQFVEEVVVKSAGGRTPEWDPRLPETLGRDLDHSLLFRGAPVNGVESAFCLIRVRSARREHATGRVRSLYPIMLRHDLAWVSTDGNVETRAVEWAGWTGIQWTRITKDRCFTRLSSPEEIRVHSWAACAEAIAQYNNWRLVVSFGGPGLSFWTDAVGAREILRLRDVPNGKQRRSALRHWVSEHWRKRRDDGSSRVRQHLRGRETCSWNGMHVEIIPAPAEMAQAGLIAPIEMAPMSDARARLIRSALLEALGLATDTPTDTPKPPDDEST